jgi:hypothetical protein
MGSQTALAFLSAVITPAVLISACGTLILSTSNRLARVVDRVRVLGQALEHLFNAPATPFADLRRKEVHQQLELQTRRGRLLQRSLTSHYVALGVFVGTTISIAIVAFVPAVAWMPGALGIFGMLVLFYGCMLLIGETRLALRSVDLEMEFVLRLQEMYAAQRVTPGAPVSAGPVRGQPT